MPRKRFLTHMTLTGALITNILLTSGCGSGPKYGAARKHKKSCDCPHFNALPAQGNGAVHARSTSKALSPNT